jgi:hypothetical protein
MPVRGSAGGSGATSSFVSPTATGFRDGCWPMSSSCGKKESPRSLESFQVTKKIINFNNKCKIQNFEKTLEATRIHV